MFVGALLSTDHGNLKLFNRDDNMKIRTTNMQFRLNYKEFPCLMCGVSSEISTLTTLMSISNFVSLQYLGLQQSQSLLTLIHKNE